MEKKSRFEEDRLKLYRLRRIEDNLVKEFIKAVDTNTFPPYYDRWVKLHLKVGHAIVELKYELNMFF